MEGWETRDVHTLPGVRGRIIQRLLVDERNRLLDFALVYEVRDGGKWVPVKKYDSSHGTVHSHTYSRSGKPPKKIDVCPGNRLDEGFAVASEDLWDNLDKNRRRYFRG